MISKVFNMDCMDFMKDCKDKQFDLAIVDPPYGIGKVKNSVGLTNRDQKFAENNKTAKWNNNIPPPQYFKELYRISKNQIIWGENYYGENIIHCGRLVHNKHHTPLIKNLGTMSDCDLASQSFDRTIKIFEYQWSGNVQNGKMNITNVGPDARIHPTQKPIALYKWCLELFAKEGDKILDTHLGSGSSRIACYDYGFDFWACELDKDYFEAQEKRFKDHISQLKLAI